MLIFFFFCQTIFQMCYTDYLKLIKTYGIIEYDISLSEGDDGDEDIENVVPSNRM